MRSTALLRSLFELRPDRWRPLKSAVLAVGTAVPLILGAWQGRVLLGLLSSIGALYAGLASYGNVHHVRLRRMVLTSLVVAVLTIIGTFASDSDIATVLCVGLAGFIFSLYGATSSANSIVGILGTAILIIVSGLPSTGEGALGNGLAVLLGGFLETALIWAIAPLFPSSIERDAVAETFSSLARFIDALAEPGSTLIPDAAPFHEARARLEESKRTHEHAQLRHALRVAETLRTGLVGFASSRRVVVRVSQDYAEQVERLSAQLTSALNAVADAVTRGNFEFDPEFRNEPASEGAIREWREYNQWVTLLASSFEEFARPPVPGEMDVSEAIAPPHPIFHWGRIASLLGFFESKTLRSIAATHAARFGLAVAAGTALYRWEHIPLGYWVPLTVTFLLRPDYATTLVKGFGRLVGTIGGIALASFSATLLPPSPALLVGLSILGAWLSFALYDVSFAGYIASLTFYVVMGISAQGKPEPVVGLERMESTTVGVLLAVVATFLWPVWESGKLRAVLRDAFRAQVTYGEELVHLTHGGPLERTEGLRHRGRALRVEAERLLEAVQLEPKWTHKHPIEEARGWVEALDGNAAVLLTLHAQALEQRAGRIPDEPQSRQTLQRAISEARLMSESLA